MRGKKFLGKKEVYPYFMVLPAMAFITIFMIYPIINTFILSFQYNTLMDSNNVAFIGISNFVDAFQDRNFIKAIGNSAFWTVANVLLQLFLGMTLALLLNMKFKFRGLIRALAFMPWAVGGMLVALIWGFMFSESVGVIGDLLLKVGIIETRMSWFSSGTKAMWAVIIANTWRGIPFFAISILSSLQTIPGEIYESANVDGANAWQKYWKITLPLIKDTVVLTTLLRTIWTLNVVDVIYGMTDGGPNFGTLTIPVYIMKLFNSTLDMGYTSAMAVIMVIALIIFAAVYLKITKYDKEGYY